LHYVVFRFYTSILKEYAAFFFRIEVRRVGLGAEKGDGAKFGPV
jgi:hypothetical protein